MSSNNALVPDSALDILLREARSYSDYKPQPVGDDTLRLVIGIAARLAQQDVEGGVGHEGVIR